MQIKMSKQIKPEYMNKKRMSNKFEEKRAKS